MKHIVDLSWDGTGKVIATEKKSGDITTYHLKKDDKPEGSVVIWEYPIADPPFGLYIGGCDPYAIGQRGIIGQIRRTSLSRRQHRGKYSDCERLNITVQHRE